MKRNEGYNNSPYLVKILYPGLGMDKSAQYNKIEA